MILRLLSLLLLLLPPLFSVRLEAQPRCAVESPLSAAGSYSVWDQNSMSFRSQTHLVLYQIPATDRIPVSAGISGEHRFYEKEKTRYLPSVFAASEYIQLYAGYRFLPLYQSRYLADSEKYTGFCRIPQPRSVLSGFLKITNHPFIPGIFLTEGSGRAGIYWVHPAGYFFTAYHPELQTGTVYWNTLRSLNSLGFTSYGEILKLPESFEGYAFASFQHESLRTAAEAEKRLSWEKDYTENRLFRSGQITWNAEAKLPYLHAAALMAQRDQSEHRMKYYEIRTGIPVSGNIYISAGANHRQYSLRTYHLPRDKNSNPVRNTGFSAGLYTDTDRLNSGIRTGYDFFNKSVSASLWLNYKYNEWHIYGGAEWQKNMTPFMVFREEGDMESSLKFYPGIQGSALFKVRSDIVQLRLQTFLSEKKSFYTILSFEISLSL